MMEREPFDIKDYRQRLRDRSDDHELQVDGMRVEIEMKRLNVTIAELRARTENQAGIITHLQNRLEKVLDRVDAALSNLNQENYGNAKAWLREIARKEEIREVKEGGDDE